MLENNSTEAFLAQGFLISSSADFCGKLETHISQLDEPWQGIKSPALLFRDKNVLAAMENTPGLFLIFAGIGPVIYTDVLQLNVQIKIPTLRYRQLDCG